MLYNTVDAISVHIRGMAESGKPKRVSDLLEQGFDSFSRSQKAIARYIIDHVDEIGYLSAEELARSGEHVQLHRGQVRTVLGLQWLSRSTEGGS